MRCKKFINFHLCLGFKKEGDTTSKFWASYNTHYLFHLPILITNEIFLHYWNTAQFKNGGF